MSLTTPPQFHPSLDVAAVAATDASLSRTATAADLPAIEALHDLAFGPGALTRAAYRVREGCPPLSPWCRVMCHGPALIAAIRYTKIRIGGHGQALLLGPLAVAPACANQGHGRRLLADSLDHARSTGITLVVLVGDPPYYARFGFQPVAHGRLLWPGPVDPQRVLMLELQAGCFTALHGKIVGTD